VGDWERNVALLFAIIGVMAWQYGGTLAVMPAVTADYYGPKNMGLNYGLVFLGWGVAFLTQSWDGAFYLSAGLLVAAVLVSRAVRRPS
jgi:OFA family oxalate/formate antiporter-like MFS transporter